MKPQTPGEKAALYLTLGEALVQLVRDTGLLKPKRRRTVKRRKRRTKAELADAAVKPKKPRPAPLLTPDDDE